MDQKENLVSLIVALEWEMFSKTKSMGGPAHCQQNPDEFGRARRSQSMGLSEDILKSYLSDLQQAKQNGRNLVTEKYARMMATTLPDEYARIEHLLPPLDPGVAALIDRIADIVLDWGKELGERYPNLTNRGRPLHTTHSHSSVTSVETYFRGELATYSLGTLKLYLEHVQRQKAAGINGTEAVLEFTVKLHGYDSLIDAETKLQRHR